MVRIIVYVQYLNTLDRAIGIVRGLYYDQVSIDNFRLAKATSESNDDKGPLIVEIEEVTQLKYKVTDDIDILSKTYPLTLFCCNF